MEFIKRVLDTNINPKRIGMFIIVLILINSLFFAVFAENLNTNEDTKPLASRANEILGRLIGPGNYSGSVDANTNPVDFFTIYLNGSTSNTDLINIYIETLSPRFGVIDFYNPDMFTIDWNFFSSFSGQVHLSRRAITSAYHYIGVASPFMGTINYWLNISVRKSTNPQNDGNNDFANCTIATNDDSFNEYMNYSFDYWDLYKITLPPNRNLTVTGEPSGSFDIVMQLYDAPNSSSSHILKEADSGLGGEPEVLYFETNVSAFTVYIRIYPWWDVETGFYWLNFTIIEPNLGPRINLSDPKLNLWSSNPGIEIDEDKSSVGEIDLSHHFTDDGYPADPGELTYNYSTSDTNISVDIAPDSKVTFAPASNWSGSAIITFLANDSKYNVSDEINISVLPVNDPPIIEPITEQVWTQGTPVLVELNISDIDDDQFTITENTTLFNVNQANRTLKFIPNNSQVGTYHINVTVTDGELNDSALFSAQIKNINDPPVLVRVGGKNPVPGGAVEFDATEDQWNNYTVEVSDIDHDIGVQDVFKFSVNTTDTAFMIDEQTGNISFFPLQEHVGFINITINVTDGNGGLAEQNLSFTIKNVNDAPENPEIKLINKTDLNISCSVDEVIDEDGDILTYSWDFGDNSTTINLGRNVNHSYAEPGEYNVLVTVTDPHSGVAMDSLMVNVTAPKKDGDDKNDTNGNITFIDIDDDGLDDLWEILNFGDLNQNATSDYDKDGFTDLQEFENKSSPTDKSDTPIKDKDDKKDDDDPSSFSLPSGPEAFMYITGILAIINLILIIIIIFFFMMRKKRTGEAGEGRAPWPEEKGERFTVPCPECGQMVDEYAKECPYCGEEIDLAEGEEDYREEEDWETEGRGRPRGARKAGGARGRGREPEYDEEESEWVPEDEEDWEEEEYYEEGEEPEEEWDEEEYSEEGEEPEEGEEWDEEDDEEYYEEGEEPEEEWDDEEYDEDEEPEKRYDEEYDEGEYDDGYYEDKRYKEDNYRPSDSWGRQEEKPAWDSGRGRRGYRR